MKWLSIVKHTVEHKYHGKHLKAPKISLSKVWQEVQCFNSCLLAKVKHLWLNSPKLGIPTPIELSFNIINYEKWSDTPY